MKRIILYLFALTFMMGIGTTAVLAESDNNYRESIQALVSFKVIDGEADDVDSSERLTRGTAALWLYNLLEPDNEPEKSVFDDVIPGTKTADAILTLQEMGVVSGYGDGKFRPRNVITYQEFTKLLIDLLGYKNAVSVMGSGTDGYVQMIYTLDLDKGVDCKLDQGLSVGEGARILYNALQVEMLMKQPNGNRNELVQTKTLLDTYKDIYRIEGKVLQNAYTGLNSPQGAGQGFITIGDQRYLNKHDEYNRFLGRTVTAYYREEADGESIVYIREKGDVKEITVNAEQIIAEESNREKMVYEDEDSGRKKTAKIAASADVIYNEKANADLDLKYFYPECGEIRAVDSDNNGVYDIIFITAYDLFFVSHVSEDSGKIYNRYIGEGFLPSIELDLNNDVVEIFDSDGEEMEFSDISPDKIALIAHSETGDTPYCRIVLSDRISKGKLQSVSGEQIMINNTELEQSKVFLRAVENEIVKGLQAGKEYTLYIDAFGKVAGYELDYSGVHYGYLKIVYKTDGEEEVYAKIFDESGEWKLLNVEKSVLLDGIKRTEDEFLTYMAPNSFVRYTATSKMKLISIENAVLLSEDDDENSGLIQSDIFRKATLSSTSNNNKYYSNNKSFSNEFFMEDDTVIFLIPTGSSASDFDFLITDRSYLVSERRYDMTVYDMDEYMFSRIYTMYYDSSSAAGLESILGHDDCCMIVSSVGEGYTNGDVVSVVFGYMKGQKWSYTSSEANTFTGLKKGDIIRTKYDDSGKLSKYIMVHRLGTEDITTNVDDVNNAIYITGNVVSVDYANKRVRIREGKDRTLIIPESIGITVYKKDREEIRMGTLQDVDEGDYLVFRMRSSVPKEIFVIKE